MLPDGGNGHDANDVGEGREATLCVGMELPAQLGEICDVVWPGERYGEGGETPQDESGGYGKEEHDEDNGCVEGAAPGGGGFGFCEFGDGKGDVVGGGGEREDELV